MLASSRRVTGETEVEVVIEKGRGYFDGDTTIPFLNHMLETLAMFSNLGLRVRVRVVKLVDDHHVMEDVAIALGEALDKLLGDRKGLRRIGFAFVPMDDALAAAFIDLVKRPYFVSRGLRFSRETIAGLSLENVEHFLRTLAYTAKITMHVWIVYGVNDHHKVEALFKAVALALKEAMQPGESPSTKQTLL